MTSPTLIPPAWVWLRKSSLDRRIALGADPHESPELARRAQQLSSPRSRAGLAAGLCRMVEAAEKPHPVMTSQVPLNRARSSPSGSCFCSWRPTCARPTRSARAGLRSSSVS